ncbi:MAG TPA: galactose oxidase-like domain-containing protein [Terriglobales bacterium]|nr:galactose oxidase-like domain-containing protein [Terriglobales bacterium]
MNRHCVSSRARQALVCSLFVCLFAPVMMAQPSVQGQWSTLQTLMPINPVHAALLNNGKVLVVAGSGNCPPSQSGCPSGPPYGPSNNSGALLWDPATQAITQFSLSWDMFCNGMVLLPDGRAFINGGTIQYDPFYGQPQTSIFDPSTNTFTAAANMAHGRWYPTVVTLGDGRVMTFSGLNETGGTNTSVELYTVGTGWSTQYIASWTPDLYPRLHLLPNGTVLYSGAQTKSKLFDPSTTTWNTNLATTNYSGARTYGTSVLLPLTPANNYDPVVMIMGGGSPATNTTELIDMGAATPKWVYGLSMSQARIEMNAVILPNGKVLALGGSVNDEDTGSLSLNADLYDLSTLNLNVVPPVLGTVTSAGANATQRLYHSVALLLPDATVWLAGGNPSRGTYNNTMEIYQPAYLFNSDGTLATRPSIASAPASISYGNTFSVTTPDAANISSAVLVRNGAVTHAFGMDQRMVGMSFTVGSGALTITAPPNGNIAPPGYYMLFLLNSSGVPSLATFVQMTSGAAADFSVSATPSSQTVAPSKSTTYTVTVTPSNGFNGNVTFSVSGLPSGASAVFNPTSVTGSGSSTMTVTTSSSTPTGTYPLTITATSGALMHTAQVTLNVADFTLSVSPSSQTVKRGSQTTYTVTISPSGPFSSTVKFSGVGLPKNTTATFNPTSVVGSGTSTLKVSVRKPAKTGTYQLTVTGTGGGTAHSQSVGLVIQ